MTADDYRHGQGAYVTAGPFKGALGTVVGIDREWVGLSFTPNPDKVDAWFRPGDLNVGTPAVQHRRLAEWSDQ